MADDIRFGTDGWRAVIGDTFTYANVRRIADAAGRVFAEDQPGCRVIVAYDTRFEAGSFAAAAAEVLAARGLAVTLSDRAVPTPTLSWAADRSDAKYGVMLTASHNPAEWCGFKIKTADGGSAPPDLTERVEAAMPVEPPAERADFETADIVTGYLEDLKSLVDGEAIRAAQLRVVVDPLYGAGQGFLAQVLTDLGCEVVEVHGEVNPGFGGLHPEPIPPHIDEASALVRDGEFAAGFFTDGDADRIGACDTMGGFVNPQRIFSLVLRHLVEDKGMRGTVVKTLTTSVLLDRLCDRFGLVCETTPVGFKYIYEKMVADDVLIGGEESGGIGVPAHLRERDGLYMALLLAEMMAQGGKGLDELLRDLFDLVGRMEYGRVDLRLDAATADSLRAKLPTLSPAEVGGQRVARIDRTEGVKFHFAEDAWLMLRASGTEPLARVYAEAPTQEDVEALLAGGRSLVLGEA
ncbi:MAG TPA: phosphoglucosamine mutase [Coriobacteriia bacterium]